MIKAGLLLYMKLWTLAQLLCVCALPPYRINGERARMRAVPGWEFMSPCTACFGHDDTAPLKHMFIIW